MIRYFKELKKIEIKGKTIDITEDNAELIEALMADVNSTRDARYTEGERFKRSLSRARNETAYLKKLIRELLAPPREYREEGFEFNSSDI